MQLARSLSRRAAASTLLAAGAAGAAAPAIAPPEHERVICEGPACHVLAFPAFVPSSLTVDSGGLWLSGAYETAPYAPFVPVGGRYARVTGGGGVDISKLILEEHLSFTLSASGSIGTGVNPGTLLGDGAELGGGLEVGFVLATWVRRPHSSRLGLVVRSADRGGESLLVTRAVPAVRQNPLDQKLTDASTILDDATGRIMVPFRETRVRADIVWTYVVPPWFSLQMQVGLDHRHRYQRVDAKATGDDETSGLDVDLLALPVLGLAGEVSLAPLGGCRQECWPLAFMVEYQLARTLTKLGTIEEAIQRDPTEKSRAPHQVFAAGIHYASEYHADLDAAATFFAEWNMPPELSYAAGPGPGEGRPRQLGGLLSARYIWP